MHGLPVQSGPVQSNAAQPSPAQPSPVGCIGVCLVRGGWQLEAWKRRYGTVLCRSGVEAWKHWKHGGVEAWQRLVAGVAGRVVGQNEGHSKRGK